MKLKSTLGTAMALAVACIGLFCINAQTWSLVYSNSMDGWKGPVAVTEMSADGSRMLRTIPIQYQPFNTNTVFLTNIVATIMVTNRLALNTNAVNKLVQDGTVCAVRGHIWEGGCGVFGCLVIHGDAPMRHCVVCKKTERRELGPWQ